MSAKSGDSVGSCFYRLAADLAGVVLTKPELEVASKIVKAEIINHPQDEADAESNPMPQSRTNSKGGGGGCIVQ